MVIWKLQIVDFYTAWSSRIWSYLVRIFSYPVQNAGKMQIRITPNTDTFYTVLTFLGENYLTNNATKFVEPIMESCHQDLKTLFICCKQFKNYDPFKLNLNCEIIRENLRAIFELSNNSSNCNKSQIFLLACKIYTKWHLCKWLIYIKQVVKNAIWSLTPFFLGNHENFCLLTNSESSPKVVLFQKVFSFLLPVWWA